MAVKIETMSVVVPGQVVRKFNGKDTTLTITGDQARHIYDVMGTVVSLFDSVDKSAADE